MQQIANSLHESCTEVCRGGGLLHNRIDCLQLKR